MPTSAPEDAAPPPGPSAAPAAAPGEFGRWLDEFDPSRPVTPPPPRAADRAPPAAPPRPIEGGVVLDGRFKVIERIASGGIGSVFLCEDLALRSRAAVKILDADDDDLRRRFLDEASLLANLRHPLLVQVLAVGETDGGSPYMAMEHLGPSLASRLEGGGLVPWREAVEIAAQAATALGILHGAGVVHRDVKPSNIAEIRGVNGRTLVKLIDLGIARVEDWAAVQSGGPVLPPRRPTREGLVIGTPGFVPPEAGDGPPDARYDVYGLGVTLYKIITGVMPDQLDPRPMREVRPGLDVPRELEALVVRSISVFAEQRPASMAEFSRELAAIQTNHAEPEAPVLFDDCYELIELLGVGAKAEVYRAYHRDARLYVALKLLREEIAGDAEERLRFDREARVLSALSHPSIPRLVECRTGAQRRRPFIAMTLQRGRPVADLLTRRLSPEEVAVVGEQLAGGLQEMHARGSVHRDLNRSNVLIDLDEARGGAPLASIVDFGQVELLPSFWAHVDGERYPTPPEARARLGTGGLEHLAWTAPEARASKIWSGKSDVYSLGLLLYLLLTGKTPTKGERGVVISPATIVRESRGPLADAILAALQEDPQRRLDAAGLHDRFVEIVAEIREIRELEAAEASDESPRSAASLADGVAAESLSSRSGRRESVAFDGRAAPPRMSPRGWLPLVPAIAAVLALGVWIGRSTGPGASADRGAPLISEVDPSPAAPTAQGSPDRIAVDPDDTGAECRGPVQDEAEGSLAAIAIPEDTVAPVEAEPTSGKQRTRSRSPKSTITAVREAQLEGEAPGLARCLPGSAASVDVTIEVAADGSIAQVSLSDPSLPTVVQTCMKRRLQGRRLELAARPSTHRLPLRRANGERHDG